MSNIAATNTVTRLLVHEIEKHPKLGITVGSLCVVISLALAVFNWNEYKRLSKPPLGLKVAEASRLLNAGERQNVILTDAKPDCKKHIDSKRNHYSEISFSDERNSILVIGNYSRTLECNSISGPLKGVAEIYSQDKKARFFRVLKDRINFGLEEYTENNRLIDVCTFCGPTNSLIGIMVCLAITLCGLVLIFESPRMHRKYLKQLSETSK